MRGLHRGAIICTNYGTGPYVITNIDGPCDCPELVASLDGYDTPSATHFHINCQLEGQPERGDYWLNGYRLDGTNVWNSDRITVIREAAQKELFA